MSRHLAVAVALWLAAARPPAAAARKANAARPKPDLADVKYGPHERNVLDLWKAKSTGRPRWSCSSTAAGSTPAQGGPAPGPARRPAGQGHLRHRRSTTGCPPGVAFPGAYVDCARAIQFARSKAKEWNLDPTRVAATGGSAGAGTSLWIGFHDDLADPKSDDPVLRQSTRLTCMAVLGAQSSYDPRVIKEWVGEAAAKHPALTGFYGLKADELDTPKAHKLYEAASPITHLTKDDPPVYAFYNEARELPMDAKPGDGIHHINFGLRVKERMDKLGIECVVRHQDEGADPAKEVVAFLVKHLKPKD